MADCGKRRRPQLFSASERKRRKTEYKKQRIGRIAIGDNIEKWNKMKEKNQQATHVDMATFLLDLLPPENLEKEVLSKIKILNDTELVNETRRLFREIGVPLPMNGIPTQKRRRKHIPAQKKTPKKGYKAKQ